MTARVFVPLVGANGEGAQIFEAIAAPEAPEAHPARLSPQISELFDFGLYGIGQNVREAAMRFIAARREKLWLNRSNGRTQPWHLRISDLQVGRLSEENARSAGLGLTLAAILQAFDRRPDIVFATGEIQLPSGPGEQAVGVGPVGGLRGKLALIGDYLVQHRKALEGKLVTVALPAKAVDGRPVKEMEASTLTRLEAAAKECGARIQCVFADSLDAFEDALGPFKLTEILTPKRAAALAAVLAVAAIGFATWHALSTAKINLAFEPIVIGGAADADPAPQRAHYDKTADKFELLERCYDAQREPLVVGGETLILRVRASDALPLASRVRPPRFFIAAVSRAADPVLLDAEHFRPMGAQPSADASVLMAAVPVEPVEDEVRLFVVATRDANVEITAVQDGLRKALQGLSGAAVLATTTTYLQDRLGDEIAYQFKVTTDPDACPT